MDFFVPENKLMKTKARKKGQNSMKTILFSLILLKGIFLSAPIAGNQKLKLTQRKDKILHRYDQYYWETFPTHF